eukprot:5834268-Amphidinium_carterae.1
MPSNRRHSGDEVLERRAQEVRPHVTYLIFDSCFMALSDAWSMLRHFAERLPHPSQIAVGQQLSRRQAWQWTPQSSTSLGQMLLAIMHLITNSLGTPRPTLVKWSRGIESAPFVSEYEAAEIWFWHRTDHDIAEQRWLDTERSRSGKEDPDNIPNLPLCYWTTQLTNSRHQENAEWAHYHVLQVWHTPSTNPAVDTSTNYGIDTSRTSNSRTTTSKPPQPQQPTPAASIRPPPGPPPTPMSAAIPIQPTVHPQPMATTGQSSSTPFPPQPPAPTEAIARSRSRDQPRPQSTPSSHQSMQQDEHPRPPAPPPGPSPGKAII